MAASILTTICAQRRLDVAAAKAVTSEDALRVRIAALDEAQGGPVDLRAHLEAHARARQQIAVCAEFKRASPSKGDIAVGVDAAAQALQYVTAGAAVVSVLTEPKWFKGSLDDLLAVRSAVTGFAAAEGGGQRPRPLVLRKDFIIDAYQMLEARAYGADTALLIVAVLTDAELATLVGAARAVGMEPLVEVNNEEELARALACGAKVIGVNNRNLHTFKVDLTTTERLAAIVAARGQLVPFPPSAAAAPADAVLFVALSGIRTRRDALRFERCGCSAILVGESLMRAADPSAALQALVSGDGGGRVVRVKVCGVRTPEAALAAAQAGADFIGLIFAPASRRCVSVDAARAVVAAIETFRERDGVVALSAPPAASIAASTAAGASAEAAWFSAWGTVLDAACDSNQSQPLCVGVFLNQAVEEVNRIADSVGLDLIQLHGAEVRAWSRLTPPGPACRAPRCERTRPNVCALRSRPTRLQRAQLTALSRPLLPAPLLPDPPGPARAPTSLPPARAPLSRWRTSKSTPTRQALRRSPQRCLTRGALSPCSSTRR